MLIPSVIVAIYLAIILIQDLLQIYRKTLGIYGMEKRHEAIMYGLVVSPLIVTVYLSDFWIGVYCT